MIIDGKKYSEEILESLREEVNLHKERFGRVPDWQLLSWGTILPQKFMLNQK